jgi:hypothetical protein
MMTFTEEELKDVKRIRDFSERPENWRSFGGGEPFSGDDSNYCTRIGAYAVAYVIDLEESPGKRAIRTLSIATDGTGQPRPDDVADLTHAFGFGNKQRWLWDMSEHNQGVTVVEWMDVPNDA